MKKDFNPIEFEAVKKSEEPVLLQVPLVTGVRKRLIHRQISWCLFARHLICYLWICFVRRKIRKMNNRLMELGR